MCVGVVCSGGAGLMATDNHLLKEQAQQHRLQQARLPASQTKHAAAAADKPLFGPPIQVAIMCVLLPSGGGSPVSSFSAIA